MKQILNELIDGILVNPIEPDYMDFKEVNKRSKEHLDEWWEKPFIRTEAFTQTDNSYEEYEERLKDCSIDLETKEEFNQRMIEMKKKWHECWNGGVRYDVRILDGGAWDRTTKKGSYASLEEALIVAKGLL